jgi:DNA-binding Lrp family transcriptional regulator
VIDTIDEIILAKLNRNTKQKLIEIQSLLKDQGYNISQEELDERIKNLESIECGPNPTSYNTKNMKNKIIRIILITFRPSQHLKSRKEGFTKYLQDAPFIIFSGSTRGGYDWITIQAFPSMETADEEKDIFENLFGDIIHTYGVYDCYTLREPNVDAFSYTDKEYKRFLSEWNPSFLGK